MWRLNCRLRRKVGLITTCVGVGVLMAVIIPIWGWIAAGGIALIYCGWQLMSRRH
ncbi:hypothetical protein IAI10_07335 [Clostridium sp. 19966]|uniref:hypothetical protein n=1 Tax=Clostridium sp. 19966 TaxID=2768166 RepID=UPI0028E07AE3|nr:hypothetical protein [Clostridium sp. 19966]MDT8716468.1 hypothetical protein [Clostridium sp. 19966]